MSKHPIVAADREAHKARRRAHVGHLGRRHRRRARRRRRLRRRARASRWSTFARRRTRPAQRDVIHALFRGDAAALCQGNFQLGALVRRRGARHRRRARGRSRRQPRADRVAPAALRGRRRLDAAARRAGGDRRAHRRRHRRRLPRRRRRRRRRRRAAAAVRRLAAVSRARARCARCRTSAASPTSRWYPPIATPPSPSTTGRATSWSTRSCRQPRCGADTIDRDGVWSARGRVQEDLVAELHARRLPGAAAAQVDRPRALRRAGDAGSGRRATPIARRSICSPPASPSPRARSPTAIAASSCRAAPSTRCWSPAAARTTRR